MMLTETGIDKSPPIIVVHGEAGIGKTTLACSAPSPIVIQCEPGGAARIDTTRYVWSDGVEPRSVAASWEDVISAVGEILTADHDYQTLVLDSADWADRLCQEDVAKEARKPSVQEIGYGVGLVTVANKWARLLRGLRKCHDERGMTVIVLAHSRVIQFQDPTSENYDRYVMALDKRVAALLTEWSETVLFYGIKLMEAAPDVKKKKGMENASVRVVGRERVLRCATCAQCLAKNRFGLPDEIVMRMGEFDGFWRLLGVGNSEEASAEVETSTEKESENG